MLVTASGSFGESTVINPPFDIRLAWLIPRLFINFAGFNSRGMRSVIEY